VYRYRRKEVDSGTHQHDDLAMAVFDPSDQGCKLDAVTLGHTADIFLFPISTTISFDLKIRSVVIVILAEATHGRESLDVLAA